MHDSSTASALVISLCVIDVYTHACVRAHSRVHTHTHTHSHMGSGDSSMVRVPNSDSSDLWFKLMGLSPYRSGRIIFLSRVNFLCQLLFSYPFQPHVPTVGYCKKSCSFCQKCRWQVTAKHTCTLPTWLCMKWHAAWLYGVHITYQCCVSTTLQWIFKKCYKKLVIHIESHVRTVSLLKSGYKSD